MVIRCLLIEPFPESALNEQAGKMLLENYEEYARYARIYTGIHTLKSKPKFKTGAISESRITLKVDQLNSVYRADPKNAVSGAALPLPVVPSSNNTKGGNIRDQPVDQTSTMDAGVGASAALFMQMKEVMLTKAPSDKKKMDARKKKLEKIVRCGFSGLNLHLYDT